MIQYEWINKSKVEKIENGIAIYATPGKDFFNDPASNLDGALNVGAWDAPIYGTRVSGDFVFCAHVSCDFQANYDAASLIIYESNKLWAEISFERTDIGYDGLVTVVTNQISDDVNNGELATNHVYLKIARVDNCFGFYQSNDGVHYSMVRLFTLPMQNEILVGFESQSPVGNGGWRYFKNIKLEQKRIMNLRQGL